jgi:hypothetical protein
MQEFISSLARHDAGGFCRLTSPTLQRENFAAAGLPPGGGCLQRARAMFAARRPDGSQPWWALAAQAKVGPARLHCGQHSRDCETATVTVENLPLRGGGTTSAELPMAYRDGQWRIAPF